MDSRPRFAGRHAVVTGAARNIGRAVAEALAAAGAHVLAIDRDWGPGTEGLPEQGVETMQADLAVVDPEQLAGEVLERHGTVDLLINNVGVATDAGFLELPASELDMVMAVNLRTPWLLTRALVRRLLEEQRGGGIVFTSSLHDTRVFTRPQYSVSKAAIAMLVRELAHELGPRGIRVNAVSPGWIERHDRPADPAERSRLTGLVPLRRQGTAADVAPVVLALLDDDLCGYVTGANVPVDGGLALHTWVDRRG
jgi:NAD(P)-dependent dehydrogenase (short-subunit alcohol dehydrogenase family)